MRYKQLIIFLLLSAIIQGGANGQPNTDFVMYDQKQIVLQNARIIDAENGTIMEGYSILIAGGKIDKIEKAGKLIIPKDSKVIDMTGNTILPGLIMLHEHMNYFSGNSVWDHHPVSFPKLYLAAGVTTLRTAGAENPMYDLNLKRQIDKGQVPGPRMFVTGPMFNDVSGGFLGDFIISNYDEGRKATAFWADKGCTSFKVYTDISKEALKGVIDEAHSRGLMVTGHLGKMSCTQAADLGIDNIEHGFGSCIADLGLPFDTTWNLKKEDKKVKDLIDLLIKNRVVLTVTPFSDTDFGDTTMLQYLGLDERKRIEGFIKNKPPFLPKEINDIQMRPVEMDFVKKGGRIVLGADAADFGVIPGFQNHNVMISMVKGGWTPMQVIKMATIDGAAFLRIEKETGSIRVGKIADLVIVNGKPDISIHDIKKVELVFHNGIGYSSKALRDFTKGMVGRH